MIAKIKVEEAIIKAALVAYFKGATGDVHFTVTKLEDFRGIGYGNSISAEVEIDVGNVVAAPARPCR